MLELSNFIVGLDLHIMILVLNAIVKNYVSDVRFNSNILKGGEQRAATKFSFLPTQP